MDRKTTEAIKSLAPNVCFSSKQDSNEIVKWDIENSGIKEPTKAEINAEIKKLEEEYKANEYQRSRASEYPSIPDQLDEIYHNGIDSWKAVIKKTKDKHPKE